MTPSNGNTIDNKIVSLEFQNQDFEKNAKQSLSTLDRLKKALDFRGVTGKVFDGIGTAAHSAKEHVGGLSTAASNLSTAIGGIKDVAGFTMIAKAASDAYDKVKNLVKAISIEPATAGWTKYEQKTESVQTIMAATAKDWADQGAQMEFVNAQMEKLNWFTDETSYSFTDMVNNIGKFTSNQIPLEKSVTAMQGISTWAAKSGAKVEEAGRAMYNLSQAIGTGTVRLQDWKSIENANMATAEFKETVIQVAEEMGTLTKVQEGLWKTTAGSEVSVKNFNEALKDEWFTGDVLINTLDKYGSFTDKLYSYMEEVDLDTTSDLLGLIDDYKAGTINLNKEAENAGVTVARLQEILSDLGSEEMDFGRKAFQAAQEAKTFTDAIEATKDAASTAWMNVFETMFGDYLAAKDLWTKAANFLYDVFVPPVTDLQELLEGAMSHSELASKKDFDKLAESGLASPEYIANLRKNGVAEGKVINTMMTDQQWLNAALERGYLSTQDLQKGFENLGQSQIEVGEINEDLKKQLEDSAQYEEMQNLLAGLDDLSSKYSTEDFMSIVFGDGSYKEGAEDLERQLDYILKYMGLSQESGEDLRNVLISMGYFAEDTGKSILEMSASELAAIGYKREEIALIQKAQKENWELSQLMEELGVNTKTGTDHWVQGLNNIMDAVYAFQEVSGEIFSNYFEGVDSSQVYDLLKAFDEGTADLITFIEKNETFHNVLTSIASVIDLVVGNIDILAKALAFKGAVAGIGMIGGFIAKFLSLTMTLAKGAAVFEFVKGLFEGLGVDWGGLVNTVANLTTKFSDWLKAVDPLGKAMSFINQIGQKVGNTIRGWFDAFARLEIVTRGINNIKRGFKLFTEGFSDGMKDGQKRLSNFQKKVDEMGGVKPENLGEIFKMAKDEMLDWIKNFPGVKQFMKGISQLAEGVETRLKAMGVPVDAIKAAFGTLVSIVKSAFGFVGNQALKTVGEVTTLWNKFKELPVVKNSIARFGKAFEKIKTTVGPFMDGFGKQVESFKEKVAAIGGFKIENAGKIFDIFKEEILGYIENWDGFGAIKDAFNGFWEDLKASIAGNETVMSIFNSVKSFITQLAMVFSGVTLPESIEDLPQFFQSIADSIENMPTAEGGGVGAAIWNGIKFVLEKALDLVSWVTSHWKLFVKIGIVVLALKKIDTIVGDIREHFKAVNKKLRAQAFMMTAVGILALAGAIWIVAMTFKDLAQTFGTDQNSGWLEKIAPGLVSIIAILGMMTLLFRTVGKMDVKPGTAWGVAAAVAAVWVVAHAFIDLTNDTGIGPNFADNMSKLMPALISMTVIIAAMAGLFYVVGKMDVKPGTAWAVAAAVSAVWIVAHALIDMVKDLGLGSDFDESMAKIGPAILAIMAVVGSMALLFLVVGKMDPGAGTTWGIAATMAAFWVVSKAFQEIAGIDRDALEKAELAIAIITACLAGLMIVASMSKIKPATMLSIAAVMAVMGLVMAGMAHLADTNPEGLEKAINAIFKVMLSLGLLVAAAGVLKPSIGVMIMLVAIIGLVAGVVVALNHFVGVENTVQIADSIAKLFAGIALLMAAIGFVGSLGLPAVSSGLLALAGIFVVLGVVFAAIGALVSAFPQIEGWIDGGIAIFQKVIDAICYAIQHVIEAVMNAIIGDRTPLQMLADDVAYMAEVFASDEFKSNVEAIGKIDISGDVMKNLGELALVSLVGLVIGVLNGLATGLMSFLGIAKSPIQGLVDDLTYLATNLGDPTFKSNIEAIGKIEISSDVAANLAGLALIGVIGDVVGLINGISTAVLQFLGVGDSPIEGFVNDLSYMAEHLGGEDFKTNLEAIGKIDISEDVITNLAELTLIDAVTSAVGFVTGLATALTDYLGVEGSPIETFVNDLEYLATHLGSDDFKKNFEAIGNIELDSGAADNLENFADLDLYASLSGFVSGITSIASELTEGKSSVELMVSDLQTMADAFSDETFKSNLESIGNITLDEGVSSNLQEFAKIDFMLALAGLGSGIASVATEVTEGASAVEQVTKDLQTIATAFSDETFQTNLTSISGLTVPTDELQELVDALGKVTMQGFINSVLDFFNLDEGTNLEQFKTDASVLGQAMVIWSSSMKVIDGLGGFEVPEEEITKLKKSLDRVSEDGGLIGSIATFISGDKLENLQNFKTHAATLGEAITAFVGGLDVKNVSKLTTAASATSGLAAIMDHISAISMTDEYTIEFSGALGTLKDSLNEFADGITDPDKLSTTSASAVNLIDSVRKLVDFKFTGDIMDETLTQKFTDGLDSVKVAIEGLKDLDTSGVDRLKGAVTDAGNLNLKSVTEQVSSSTQSSADIDLSSKATDAVSSFTDNLDSEAVSGAVGGMMTDALNAADVSGFMAKGYELVQQIIDGMRANSGLTRAIGSIVAEAASVTSGYYGDFYNSGVYVAMGFSSGIYHEMLSVIAAARAIAEAAVNAIKDRIRQGSPSKVTMESGGFFGEGFALGILSQAKYVRESAESVGESAVTGLNTAIASIKDAMASDIDAQPVIRPVLDLSEIQSGAGDISTLLTSMSPIDPFGNFSAIGSVVEARRRQASLEDVVSALGSVERSTSNIRGGDTYNVNGITYDDGSNITEAIKTLTHAVITDRRR